MGGTFIYQSDTNLASAHLTKIVARVSQNVINGGPSPQKPRSGAPLSGAVVGIPARLAWAEVMRGGRHGHGQPQREIAADVLDVVDGSPGDPDDVVLVGGDDGAPRQLPLE